MATVLSTATGQVLASLARGASLSELAKRSRHAVVGTALATECRWEYIGTKKRIVTYTRLRIDEHIAGDSTDSEIWVRTLGGRVGKIGQVVHGEAVLLLNERTLLFLASTREGTLEVTEMAQGHFPIRKDSAGTERLVPSPRLPELSDVDGSAQKELVGRVVPEASERVRKAWRNAH